MDEPQIIDRRWKVNSQGYVLMDSDPASNGAVRRVYEHRYLFMKHIGTIPYDYVVSHINGDSTDNRLNNLVLCKKKDVFKLMSDNPPKHLKGAMHQDSRLYSLGFVERLKMTRIIREKRLVGNYSGVLSPIIEIERGR